MNLNHDLLIANERHILPHLSREELEERYLSLVRSTLSMQASSQQIIKDLLLARIEGMTPPHHEL